MNTSTTSEGVNASAVKEATKYSHKDSRSQLSSQGSNRAHEDGKDENFMTAAVCVTKTSKKLIMLIQIHLISRSIVSTADYCDIYSALMIKMSYKGRNALLILDHDKIMASDYFPDNI